MNNISEERKKIDQIMNNYNQLEKSIVGQLKFAYKHGTTIGSFREDVWKSLFDMIIPKKFAIERSVFIIDSYGHISKEVDLAIFDEQYTPYIFKYGQLKFIPIEAVAVVVECKSTGLKSKSLESWADSINILKTSDNAVVRLANSLINNSDEGKKTNKENTNNKIQTKTQTCTRPLKILCHLKKSTGPDVENLFDIVIHTANKEKLKVNYIYKTNVEDKDLSYWYKELNHNCTDDDLITQLKCTRKIEEDYIVIRQNKEVTLLSFIFQINQLLMLINNPLFFPHMAYVDMFTGKKRTVSK